MQRHYFSRNLISAQISAAETWSRCWGVGAKIVITQSEGKTGKGRKQEWEATILGSQQIRAGCWEIPKTFFSSARYPSLFPKALRQTSDLFFPSILSGTMGAANTINKKQTTKPKKRPKKWKLLLWIVLSPDYQMFWLSEAAAKWQRLLWIFWLSPLGLS